MGHRPLWRGTVGTFPRIGFRKGGQHRPPGERIFIELMTSDRQLKASRKGPKSGGQGSQPVLTPTSIKFNRFLKFILLELKPLLACFGFVTSQKWLVSVKINLRKRLNLIDIGADVTQAALFPQVRFRARKLFPRSEQLEMFKLFPPREQLKRVQDLST
jgi:hypothetical protein